MKRIIYILLLIIIIIIISISFTGCANENQEIYNEKREYISTSIYDEMAEYADKNYLSLSGENFKRDFIYYNNNKYVQWLVTVEEVPFNRRNVKVITDAIGEDIDIIFGRGYPPFTIECNFVNKLDKSIEVNDKIVVSGMILDSVYGDYITLNNCRVEKFSDAEIEQFIKDTQTSEENLIVLLEELPIRQAEIEKKALEKKKIAEEREKTTALAKAKQEGVSIGMTQQEVLNSNWGNPKEINKTTTAYGTSEQWVYYGNKYLYFDDGILTAIQE